MRPIALLFLLLLSTAHTPVVPVADPDVCLSAEERKLYGLINAYRKTARLPAIPLSARLTRVAQTHVRDLMAHFDQNNTNDCNAHSWSDQGNWTPCCYTPDHQQAECMWNKPKEIAGYPSSGYEIAYWSSAGANADEALDGWKSSSGHNGVVMNLGIWKSKKWQAIGIGLYEQYGVVWFGDQLDDTTPANCR